MLINEHPKNVSMKLSTCSKLYILCNQCLQINPKELSSLTIKIKEWIWLYNDCNFNTPLKLFKSYFD